MRLLLVALLVATNWHVLCHGASAGWEFNGTITLGGTISRSGSFVVISRSIMQTYTMFHEWVNQVHGGIVIGDRRYKVEFYLEDDASSPESVRIITESMVNGTRKSCLNIHSACYRSSQDASFSPDFYFANYGSVLAEAMVPVTEPAKKLLLAGTSGDTALFLGTKLFFSTLTKSERSSQDILRSLLIRKSQYNRVAYINQDLGFHRSVCGPIPTLLREFENQGLKSELVYRGFDAAGENGPGHLSAMPSSQELLQQIRAIESHSPDILVACLYYEECIEFMKLAEQEHLDTKATVITSCVTQNDFVKDLGETAKYVLGMAQYSKTMPSYGPKENLTAAQFNDWYTRVHPNHTDVPYQAASHFAMGVAMVYALEKAQSLEPLQVALALSRLDIDTFFGRIQFDENGQNSADMIYLQHDTNLTIHTVLPESIATGRLIHPQPTFTQRQCMATNGENSCLCSDQGCPTCTSEHWLAVASDCRNEDDGSRLVEFQWVNGSTVVCQGGLALPDIEMVACSYIPFLSDSWIVLTVFSWLGFLFCFANVIALIILQKKPIIRLSQPLFMGWFTFSASMLCVSAYLLLGENTSFSCIARVWFTQLSQFGMISCLIVKLYRVWRLVISNNKLQRIKITRCQIIGQVLGLMLIPFGVLLIWSLVGPPVPTVQPIMHLTDAHIDEIVCHSPYTDFGTILYMLQALLLIVGCKMAITLRGVNKNLSDAYLIGLVIYNMSVLWLLGVMVEVFSSEGDFGISRAIVAISKIVMSVSSVAILLVPKYKKLDMTTHDLLADMDNSSASNQRASVSNHQSVTMDAKHSDILADLEDLKFENDKLRTQVRDLQVQLAQQQQSNRNSLTQT